MAVLLVHGMGRTRLSMWRMGHALRRGGLHVESFGYSAARESFAAITDRLTARLMLLAGSRYFVVGHSLGGLLSRAAIAALPLDVPRPARLIMLGTPNHSPRLARRFGRAWWYRWMNGDAGDLLAHESRITTVPALDIPCTIVAGTAGFHGRWSPFGDEANDGLVALSETRIDGSVERITLPVRHPFMMNDRHVREIVCARCGGPPAHATRSAGTAAPPR